MWNHDSRVGKITILESDKPRLWSRENHEEIILIQIILIIVILILSYLPVFVEKEPKGMENGNNIIALGAGLGIWGAINLLEGYGNDNPGAKSQGMKQFMAN